LYACTHTYAHKPILLFCFDGQVMWSYSVMEEAGTYGHTGGLDSFR